MIVEIEFDNKNHIKGHHDLVIFADKVKTLPESDSPDTWGTEITLSKDQNDFNLIKSHKIVEGKINDKGMITHIFFWNTEIKTLAIYN